MAERSTASAGRVRQTPSRWLIAGLLFAMLLGAVPAILLSVHIPTELGIRLAVIVALLVAALAAWESRDGGAFAPSRTGVTRRPLAHRLARIPLMALFAFFITYTTVTDGMLVLVTSLVGKPGYRELSVTGVSSPRTRCEHFNVREVRWLLNRALCASERDFDRAEVGDRLIVFGRASVFGLNVERYELRTGRHRDMTEARDMRRQIN